MMLLKEKKTGWGTIIGFTLIIFLLGAGFINPEYGIASTGSDRTAMKSLAPFSFADLAENLMPAVVNISTTKKVKMRSGTNFGQEVPDGFFGRDDFLKRFWGNMPEREYKQSNLGSGFIISKDGYIFTNNHVISKVDKIKVKLSNGKEYAADVIGSDEKTDLALIKIKPEADLPVATLGDSERLRVGDWVVAIGNPFGLERTITAGIVSAKGRVIGAGPYDNFIQTDASINPGNSGGPLFNLSGEVVGINTAIIAQGQGIGFAIPINTAKTIFNDLKTKGKVTRGWLGISVQDITEDIAQNLNLKETRGVLVGDVFPNDPADRAGIKTGDIITEIAGKQISNSHDLLAIVAALPVGTSTDVKVYRDGDFKNFKAVIAERKDQNEIAGNPSGSENYFGLAVQEITPDMARNLGLSDTTGVIVSDIEDGSPAAEAGIRPGDIITKINKDRITSMQSYIEEMKKLDKAESVLILIRRGKSSLFVTLKKN